MLKKTDDLVEDVVPYENMLILSDISNRISSNTNIGSSTIIREIADGMNGVSLPASQTSTPSLQLCDQLLPNKGPAQRGKHWQKFKTF